MQNVELITMETVSADIYLTVTNIEYSKKTGKINRVSTQKSERCSDTSSWKLTVYLCGLKFSCVQDRENLSRLTNYLTIFSQTTMLSQEIQSRFLI